MIYPLRGIMDAATQAAWDAGPYAKCLRDAQTAKDTASLSAADLWARLTKLADENIRLDNEHESFGSMEDDIIATTWGAAGKELREALGLEDEDVSDGIGDPSEILRDFGLMTDELGPSREELRRFQKDDGEAPE